jgi:hypothetical protein
MPRHRLTEVIVEAAIIAVAVFPGLPLFLAVAALLIGLP